MAGRAVRTDGARYTERMTLPWWAWPAALGGALFIAAEIALRGPGPGTILIYVAAFAAVAAGLVALGRIRVIVEDEEFRVDDAHVPLRFVAEAVPVAGEDKRALLGVDADPLAFVVQRPWIAGAVRVDLDDPADPTPYWLISSRRPAELAAALNAARGGDLSPS